MELKFYERNYYLGHNHGIADICLEHDIGEVRFRYQSVECSYIEALSKKEIAHLIISGEIVRRKIKGEVVDFFASPLMAFVHLKPEDAKKLREIDDETGNVRKVLEYMDQNKKDDYVLDVELRSPFLFCLPACGIYS